MISYKMAHLEPKSVQKSTIVLALVPVYDKEKYQRVARDNIPQTRASSRFFHQNRRNLNVPIDRHGFAPNDHILGQFLKKVDSTWVLEYIKKRETNELESQNILWKQEVPSPPPPVANHIYVDFKDQEASLDNLLLESAWSDALYLKYILKDNKNITPCNS
jgi:hypothetical protein